MAVLPYPVPEALLRLEVAGLGLRGATLGDELGEAPTLLVFLRHFG